MTPDLTSEYWERQRFSRSDDDVSRVVEGAACVYGTSPTCYLSLVARVDDFRKENLDRALYEDRILVRIRGMRGSMFVVPVSLAPTVVAATQERNVRNVDRLLQRSIGHDLLADWAARVERLLADEGDLSAAEIRERLSPSDPDVADNLKYVIAWMAYRCRIVRARVQGGWRSDRFTYALWSDWLGSELDEVDPEAAQTGLARIYLRGHGPATLDDFRWWSGMTVRDSRAALEALETREVETESGPMFDLPEVDRAATQASEGIRLLPVWDTALIGHEDRRRIVPEKWEDRVYDSSGNATSVVLVDGRAAGIWQLDGDDELTCRVAPFEELEPATIAGVEAEAERIRRALGADAIEVRTSSLPQENLREAKRNRFLSPLG